METGTLPPNWQELIEHSSEKATTKYIFMSDTWLSDQKIVDATDQLTDPFVIVPDQRKNNNHTALQHGTESVPDILQSMIVAPIWVGQRL